MSGASGLNCQIGAEKKEIRRTDHEEEDPSDSRVRVASGLREIRLIPHCKNCLYCPCNRPTNRRSVANSEHNKLYEHKEWEEFLYPSQKKRFEDFIERQFREELYTAL